MTDWAAKLCRFALSIGTTLITLFTVVYREQAVKVMISTRDILLSYCLYVSMFIDAESEERIKSCRRHEVAIYLDIGILPGRCTPSPMHGFSSFGLFLLSPTDSAAWVRLYT